MHDKSVRPARKKTKPGVNFTLRIAADEKAAISAIAERERLSEADVVRRILRRGFRLELEAMIKDGGHSGRRPLPRALMAWAR